MNCGILNVELKTICYGIDVYVGVSVDMYVGVHVGACADFSSPLRVKTLRNGDSVKSTY